jgi:hypothetical protein
VRSIDDGGPLTRRGLEQLDALAACRDRLLRGDPHPLPCNPTRLFLPLKAMEELLVEPCARRCAAPAVCQRQLLLEMAVLTANTNKPVKRPSCWF